MWQFTVIGLAALVQVAPAAAQPDWRWQTEDEGCTLRQQINVGTQFEIDRTPGNDVTRIALFDRKESFRDTKPVKAVTIAIDPSGRAKADGEIGPGEEISSRSIALSSFDGTLLQQLSTASSLTLSHPKFETVQIEPRSIGAAIKALSECEDRKMRKWGVDPGAWRALAVKPIPETPPATWLDRYDYPVRAKIYRTDIMVVARLNLDAAGAVQGCEIVNQPPVEFREAVCSALNRKARLKPARDAMGHATPAPYVLQIRFGAFRI